MWMPQGEIALMAFEQALEEEYWECPTELPILPDWVFNIRHQEEDELEELESCGAKYCEWSDI